MWLKQAPVVVGNILHTPSVERDSHDYFRGRDTPGQVGLQGCVNVQIRWRYWIGGRGVHRRIKVGHRAPRAVEVVGHYVDEVQIGMNLIHLNVGDFGSARRRRNG